MIRGTRSSSASFRPQWRCQHPRCSDSTQPSARPPLQTRRMPAPRRGLMSPLPAARETSLPGSRRLPVCALLEERSTGSRNLSTVSRRTVGSHRMKNSREPRPPRLRRRSHALAQIPTATSTCSEGLGMKLARFVKPYSMMPPWLQKYSPARNEVTGSLDARL